MRKDSLLNKDMPNTALLDKHARVVLYLPFVIGLLLVLVSYTYVSGEMTTLFSEMVLVSMLIGGSFYGLVELLVRN